MKARNAALDIKTVHDALATELQLFKEKYKVYSTQTFNLAPKLMMSLLLNFESYDQTTKVRDIYMPAERLLNFSVGSLRLNFIGKLRLTSDRENLNSPHIITPKQDGPNQTYGVVEDTNLVITFDKPVVLHYMYIRPHYTPKESERNRSLLFEMELKGYSNEKMVFKMTKPVSYNNKAWTR